MIRGLRVISETQLELQLASILRKKTAFRAATLRLEQNLALADLTPDGEEALVAKLVRWETIGKRP